jgi:hypothetical protein
MYVVQKKQEEGTRPINPMLSMWEEYSTHCTTIDPKIGFLAEKERVFF